MTHPERTVIANFSRLLDGHRRYEAAERIGVTYETLRKWASGERPPPMKYWCAIGQAFECDWRELVRETEQEADDDNLDA